MSVEQKGMKFGTQEHEYSIYGVPFVVRVSVLLCDGIYDIFTSFLCMTNCILAFKCQIIISFPQLHS